MIAPTLTSGVAAPPDGAAAADARLGARHDNGAVARPRAATKLVRFELMDRLDASVFNVHFLQRALRRRECEKPTVRRPEEAAVRPDVVRSRQSVGLSGFHDLTQRPLTTLFDPATANAIRRPSGETANGSRNDVPSGG